VALNFLQYFAAIFEFFDDLPAAKIPSEVPCTNLFCTIFLIDSVTNEIALNV